MRTDQTSPLFTRHLQNPQTPEGFRLDKRISITLQKISTKDFTFAAAPGDQLLQNLPRAETQQGYVVVAVCLALFCLTGTRFAKGA